MSGSASGSSLLGVSRMARCFHDEVIVIVALTGAGEIKQALMMGCALGILCFFLSTMLLGAAQEESEGGNATDDFAKLVQGCVNHLDCAVGALLIPDKNIAFVNFTDII